MFSKRNNKYNIYTSLRGSIIVIEGLIGVGKSTLGASLENYLNNMNIKCKFFPEYVNKNLLQQYISNMSKYSYSFQLFMLSKRIQTYRDAEEYANKGGVALIDRSVYGDMAFALMQKEKGFISEDEWQIYLNIMHQEIRLEPRIIVYLNCTVDTCLKRLNKRGDKTEINGYNPQYFKDLEESYNNVIQKYNDTNIVYLDWNQFSDFDGIYLKTDILDKFLNVVINN